MSEARQTAMKIARTAALLLPLAWSNGLAAQTGPAAEPAPATSQEPKPQEPVRQEASFERAADAMQQKLEAGLEELSALRERIAAEKLPLAKQLRELEGELSGVRAEYQQRTRELDGRTLDLTNLQNEIKQRTTEASYLQNLLSAYVRQFEVGLHIAEVDRYEEAVEAAKLAAENEQLSDQEVYTVQAELVKRSIARLEEALGGARFEGAAVDSSGLVSKGAFALVGPAALFRSDDGAEVGTAESRLGSFEAAALPFDDPALTAAASDLIASGRGTFPLDPSLGNAHKIAATQETLVEHVQKGGPVMVPIFVMAGAALLVALYKWLSLAFLRRPSSKQIAALFSAVERSDVTDAGERARGLQGPVGRMLQIGVEHLHESRELVEEVMFENILTVRLKLQRLLPFIAVCAASAPLLGLLGTVTGIIDTFKLITVFGSGDVKTLSGGISQALITTEFGLIVAIPSLLVHAYLSRKARGIVGDMEANAMALINRVPAKGLDGPENGAVHGGEPKAGGVDQRMVRSQVREVLGEMLGPLAEGERGKQETTEPKVG